MGWNINLISNKEIKEETIDSIIDEVPVTLSSSLGNSRQSWGWSVGVDISIPRGNKLGLSGSYGISGYKAESYAEFMKEKLEQKGHSIKIEYHW